MITCRWCGRYLRRVGRRWFDGQSFWCAGEGDWDHGVEPPDLDDLLALEQELTAL